MDFSRPSPPYEGVELLQGRTDEFDGCRGETENEDGEGRDGNESPIVIERYVVVEGAGVSWSERHKHNDN